MGQCKDKTALFRAHCQQVPKTHYSSAEHRRPHCKQDERSSSPHYAVWGTRHPTAGDPLHWCREVGTTKLPTSWFHLPRAYTPCWSCFEVLVMWLPFFLFALTQNSQDLEKSTCSRDPKTRKARGGPKELSTNISALCPLQDPQEAYLGPHWTINRSTAP